MSQSQVFQYLLTKTHFKKLIDKPQRTPRALTQAAVLLLGYRVIITTTRVGNSWNLKTVETKFRITKYLRS